jgi:hypothetical protein
VIPARKSLKFGVRYIVNGATAGSSVELKLVTRFPEAGLLDPTRGVRYRENELVGVVETGRARVGAFDIAGSDWMDGFAGKSRVALNAIAGVMVLPRSRGAS